MLRQAVTHRSISLIFVPWLWIGLFVTPAFSSPLDLEDMTPRWIEVRFEISPDHAPGRLDEEWGVPRRAYFEPDPEAHRARVRIPSEELEAQLRSTGADPVDGTFSEFLWTLDSLTGHVVHAELRGRVREAFSFGLLRSSTVVEIRVEMTTHSVAGFGPAHQIFGQSTHSFCRESQADPDCTLVQPTRYDPSRGYVNAVGSIRAVTPLATIQTFSPLGEVLFSESTEKAADPVDSGRSSHDAVCSPPIRGSCRPDLRGESS